MLQIEPMTTDRFHDEMLPRRQFNPRNISDERISPSLQHSHGRRDFRVDHPDEQQTIVLNGVERNARDLLVFQLLILDRHLRREKNASLRLARGRKWTSATEGPSKSRRRDDPSASAASSPATGDEVGRESTCQ